VNYLGGERRLKESEIYHIVGQSATRNAQPAQLKTKGRHPKKQREEKVWGGALEEFPGEIYKCSDKKLASLARPFTTNSA